jgi:hypothetical protein
MSLADFTGSDVITQADKIGSVNESYRDLYERLIGADDDYYTIEANITITQAMKVEESKYHVPLPVDCYKIRTIDARLQGGRWQVVDKFPLSSRNNLAFSSPFYRFYNTYLEILCAPSFATTSLRVRYYPPASTLSAPELPIEYALTVAEYQKNLITSPFILNADKMVYVYNNEDIHSEDKTTRTDTIIVSGDDITQAAQNKGYLYYIDEGDLYRGPIVTPFVPVPLLGYTGLVEWFRIIEDMIYYFNGTTTRTCQLDGSGDSEFYAFEVTELCKINGLFAYVLTSTGYVCVDDVSIGVQADELTSDGTYLYMRNGFNLYRYDADGENGELLSTDAGALGNYAVDRLAYKSDAGNLYAYSALVDTDIVYPLNLVTEIMSYQGAIDYRRKLEKESANLAGRLAELWLRFNKAAKRDDYKAERINNFYRGRGGNI